MVEFWGMNTEELKTGIKTVAERYGLDFVVLFGSQATGKTHAKSDVDIAYLPPVNFSFDEDGQIYLDIVGLVRREDLDLINLRKVSPLLQKQIIDSALLLYEKGPGTFEDFVLRVLRLYRETVALRRLERDYVIGKSREYALELNQ